MPKSDIKGKDTKKTKLEKLPDDVKEKSYLTRQVDTSIVILDSTENDVVLEALLFLSKYADIKLHNLNYLQQKGLMGKLLNLFKRNICILRLSLRLLDVLLNLEDVVYELDQPEHDNKVDEISNYYISHNDLPIRKFCVSILSKLAASPRIINLIFRVDLFNPILCTMKSTKDVELLGATVTLLLALLDAPATLSMLPTIENFDVGVIMMHLEHHHLPIRYVVYDVILKISSFYIDAFQRMFKNQKLVEKMLNIVMTPEKEAFHTKALEVVINCIESEETSSYFIQSLDFLNFCQWVKTCKPVYFLPCITLFENLSKINKIKQTLYDLSVEESILYFLRSNDKSVLNMTCRAICNMSEHSYCCNRMVQPVVLKALTEILDRKDEEDPQNEVAIKTLLTLARRSPKTVDILYSVDFVPLLLEYFRRGTTILPEETFLRILEMIYRFALHPLYQNDVISDKMFEDILKLINTESDPIATMVAEMLSYFVNNKQFILIFTKFGGASIMIDILLMTNSSNLRNMILLFIHTSLAEETMLLEFLRYELVPAVKKLADLIKEKSPLTEKILRLAYNVYLPLKFYKLGTLEISDKLNNNFYVLTEGWRWQDPFPFIEIFLEARCNPIVITYVVNYMFEVKKETRRESARSTSSLGSTNSRRSSVRSKSSRSSGSFGMLSVPPMTINFGSLTPDPYLARVKMLAEYVDTLLSGPADEKGTPITHKLHTFQQHVQAIRYKLGTTLIPIGFLRMGFHFEKALLFKAIGDKVCVPSALVKGRHKLYWNEVAVLAGENNQTELKMYVVDLMRDIGTLLPVGSRKANKYCDIM
ncbi:unnamed protein product [Acanthoscelides obtectus]|uniref:EDR1/CTR1/ARMC3-like peptidase-like domain-containing protein n=1 Tax=Acanthoscelides obtectus TaxID=200917 RepID=A0A9P0PZ36_ACAOB|nr:unnamed protein product [Acanthoscelides obtectus]CAK1651306.1 Armadillo repeat-containing protein 3 [Acanthoscelides obtectus]